MLAQLGKMESAKVILITKKKADIKSEKKSGVLSAPEFLSSLHACNGCKLHECQRLACKFPYFHDL